MVRNNKKRMSLRKFLNKEELMGFVTYKKQKEIYYLGLEKLVD